MQSSLTYTGAPDMQLDDTKTTETKYVPVEEWEATVAFFTEAYQTQPVLNQDHTQAIFEPENLDYVLILIQTVDEQILRQQDPYFMRLFSAALVKKSLEFAIERGATAKLPYTEVKVVPAHNAAQGVKYDLITLGSVTFPPKAISPGADDAEHDRMEEADSEADSDTAAQEADNSDDKTASSADKPRSASQQLAVGVIHNPGN